MRRGHLILCLFFVCLMLGAGNPLWASNADGKTFVFPEVAGWKQSEEIQTFSPKTLYEYINGAADLYIMYDFQELRVAEYKNEKKASVIVDVYRHKNPTYAFGIYSQERFPNANLVDIGAQGYIEKNVLNFLTGSYYVKINSYSTGEEDEQILWTFAKKVAGILGEKGALPSILSSFPAEGRKKNSEKFIAKNFLAYPFLHSAFIADYELSGKKFKLFVIDPGDKLECENMIQKYFQQIGGSERNAVEGRHTISDPYNGEIDLYWQGAYIWGILNLNNPNLRSKYLKLFNEGLKKKVSSD